MLRCNEVTRLHASEELRRASWRTRLAVRVHLMMCRWCRRYVRELISIGEAARRAARARALDPQQVEALVRRVLPEAPEPDPRDVRRSGSGGPPPGATPPSSSAEATPRTGDPP